MVRVIVAEDKLDCEHLLGTFLDESHYDVLIEEDCDFYAQAPCGMEERNSCNNNLNCSGCPTGQDEDTIIFKFRKNWFSKELQLQAYEGLKDAAGASQNRGLAAGPRDDKLQNRDWVTEEQIDIIEYMIDPIDTVDGSDPIQNIRDRHANSKKQAERGQVWLSNKVKEENFVFEEWVEKTLKLNKDEMSKEATRVANKMISLTTYANPVFSGISGWFDRYPRIPYLRATSYTEQHFDKFKKSYPFLQHLARGFKKLLPKRYGAQEAACNKIDSAFYVPDTPFTTITVNKNFRTAAHRDAGDLSTGFSNLLTLDNGKEYSGGYLIFPEFRVAVSVRPGDLLLVNNHEGIHGNTPIVPVEEGAERISLVCYFREGMLDGGSKEYEDCRRQFVDDRRLNKDHPNWKPLWNGISASMWDSEEWYQYLENKLGPEVLSKYHPESCIQNLSLDEFFA